MQLIIRDLIYRSPLNNLSRKKEYFVIAFYIKKPPTLMSE